MVSQSDFPDIWSCESDSKRVVVQVRVPFFTGDDAGGIVSQDYEWIEIPTTEVEQWTEKGEASHIQRTAKVSFPTQWGEDTVQTRHNSPRKLISSYEPTDSSPYLHARVWWQRPNDNWILQHHGWVGGVGSSTHTNEAKFWIYDFSELLSGVPIGESFTNPSIEQAVNLITRLVNDNTPIPVGGANILPPKSDAEFTQLASSYQDTDISAPLFEGASDESATAYYSLSDNEFLDGDARPSEFAIAQNEDIIELPRTAKSNFEATVIDTGNIDVLDMDAKTFTSNHDTLLDIFEWFESKTNAKLSLEPFPEAMKLVADIEPERRTFTDESVVDYRSRPANRDGEYEFHEVIDVYTNDALYEVKPINTLYLRGATTNGLLNDVSTVLSDIEETVPLVPDSLPTNAYEPPAEKYPAVTVQVPSLLDAANGVELAPTVVESDASQLDTAEREATRELTKRLEETSEGEIVLNGEPRLLPYDKLDAFEVCEGRVTYEQQPVSYEVESVKHEQEGGGAYKTRLKVSIWANERTMETIQKTMVETK